MRQRGADETARTAHPVQRRADGPEIGGVPGVLMGLQRSVGNAAVARQVGGAHAHHAAPSMAFVQRCGPTPCNCSADERTDYAEKHPDEPAGSESESAGAGHD